MTTSTPTTLSMHFRTRTQPTFTKNWNPTDVEELNLWHLHCKSAQDCTNLSLHDHRENGVDHQGGQEARQPVHCPHIARPSQPSTVQCMPEIDCNTSWVSMCTKSPLRDITQPGRMPGGISQWDVRSSRFQWYARSSDMIWTQRSSRTGESSRGGI